MALEQELKFFADKKAEWIKTYPGKFVLVKGSELVGSFDTPDQAIEEGIRQFGTDSFLVRQVQEEEREIYIPALALGLLHAIDPNPISSPGQTA